MKIVQLLIRIILLMAIIAAYVFHDGNQGPQHTGQEQEASAYGHFDNCIKDVSVKCSSPERMVQIRIRTIDPQDLKIRRRRHLPQIQSPREELQECCILQDVGQCIKQEVDNVCINISSEERNLIKDMTSQAFNTKCSEWNVSIMTCFLVNLTSGEIMAMALMILLVVSFIFFTSICFMVITIWRSTVNPGGHEMD